MKLLKIYIAFLFFFGYSFLSSAQTKWETEERIYTSGVYIIGFIDIKSLQTVGLQPKGKKVKIAYDPFYNSYQIDWEGMDGPYRMKLIALRETASAGTIFIDDYAPKNVQKELFVHNYLENDGKLVLMMADSFSKDGKEFKALQIFDDLQKNKIGTN